MHHICVSYLVEKLLRIENASKHSQRSCNILYIMLKFEHVITECNVAIAFRSMF